MIISRTPFRISFFGGGTDFPEYFQLQGGAVLSTAIHKFTYVTASRFPSRLFDYSIRLSYRSVELAKSVAEIQHRVFRACLETCGLERDIELHTVADLPSFTGLGTSSAFTVALLQSLHAFKGEYIKPLDLARQAIHVERNLLKENVGCQDQVSAAVGGFNVIEFRGDCDITVNRLSLKAARLAELESHLYLVFTRIQRSASQMEGKKLVRFGEMQDTLHAMRKMVDEGREILLSGGSLIPFGELLHQAWVAKRSLEATVTNPQIEELYDRGLAAGALGGKLLGAGGGGFFLFFVPPEKSPAFLLAFAGAEVLKPKLAAPGAKIVFSS